MWYTDKQAGQTSTPPHTKIYKGKKYQTLNDITSVKQSQSQIPTKTVILKIDVENYYS